jgi:CheY-like chemotaxis protein
MTTNQSAIHNPQSAIRKSVTILMADDDPDDRLLTKEAFRQGGFVDVLRFVCDGEDLLDYLHHRGKHANPESSPHPNLILLDLNMPRKDGREALAEIKADPNLRYIPIVVLTTSRAEEDILRTYDLGANSFIIKPVTFIGLMEVTRVLMNYWFETIELPPNGGGKVAHNWTVRERI